MRAVRCTRDAREPGSVVMTTLCVASLSLLFKLRQDKLCIFGAEVKACEIPVVIPYQPLLLFVNIPQRELVLYSK